MLKLKEIRMNKGLRLLDIAEILDVSESAASRYENESRKLNQDQITALALALEVTPGDLIGFGEAYMGYTQYLNSFTADTKKYQKVDFVAETMDGKSVKLRIRDIERIQDNVVYMNVNLRYWMKIGNFEAPAQVLTPESLTQLVSILEKNKQHHSVNLYPAKKFIEYYPTTEKWVKAIEEYDNLPIDFE